MTTEIRMAPPYSSSRGRAQDKIDLNPMIAFAHPMRNSFVSSQTSAMARGSLPGYTCCFEKDLREGGLFERIDYLMVRGTNSIDVNVVNFAITGNLESDETVTGLKPSDHLGVFARIEAVGR
jgi:hypothetical protein